MDELPWLNEYSSQTTEELLALEGTFRVDSIVCVFESALMAKEKTADLTSEERVILEVCALEREVNNGGYFQFFDSSYEYITSIVESLNRIACFEAASLTQKAISFLDLKKPISKEEFEDFLNIDDDELVENLDGCDDEYYAEIGDLSGPLLAFIKTNKDDILLP